MPNASEPSGQPAPIVVAATAVVTSVALLLLAFAFVTPKWETNDDVAMAMVAAGHGIAGVASPELFFSNVIWGHVIQLMPTLGSVSKYVICTYLALTVAGAVILRNANAMWGGIGGLAAFVLLMAQPVIFPQFTLNAGLLTVCAALSLGLYLREGSPGQLLLAMLLAYAGYLIRAEEFFLVAGIALPLLCRRSLHAKSALLGCAALGLAIGLSAVFDAQTYQGPSWEAFQQLNHVRAAFTDYGAGKLLLHRPDLMQQHGLSRNDVELISTWFAEDRTLASPQTLRSIVEQLGTAPDWRLKISAAEAGVTALAGLGLLWYTAPAVMMLALYPSIRLACAWLLAIGAFACLGFMGRPGVLRVYMPVLALLVISPLLDPRRIGGGSPLWLRTRRGGAALLLLTGAASANAWWNIGKARELAPDTRTTLRQVAAFPNEPVVIWGDMFPFEMVYAPLRRPSAQPPLQLYAIGAFTLAPFAVSAIETAAGRGMLPRMLSPEGVLLMAREQDISRLAIYCLEHHDGRLFTETSQSFDFARIQRVRCSPSPAPGIPEK